MEVTGATHRCPRPPSFGAGGRLTLQHPLEVKWPCFGYAGPAQKAASGERKRVCLGRGGSESMGCSAGADPPRKGSERAGQGQGCRLGPWEWFLRPQPGQQVAINQFPSLSLQHRCSALVLSDVQEEGLGQGVACGKNRVLGLRVCRPAQGAWRAACLGLYLPWSTGTRCPLLHVLQAEDPVLAFMGANLEKLAI